MKETKTIEEKARQKPQENSDEDMGIKPPHISDEEMVRMIAEARKEEGKYISREEMKQLIRARIVE